MNGVKNILVVEDDEGFNALMQKTLQRAGFQTAGAVHGQDAIARIQVDGADMMLLDYMLPDMTGKDVVLHLAEKDVHTPFIIVTGHGDEKIAVEMLKLGARDYMIKTTGFMDMLPRVVERTVKELEREYKLEKAEEALRESEEKLRAIFDNAMDGILVADTERKTFIAGNRAICMMLGYTHEEMQGMPLAEIHPEKDLPHVIEQFELQAKKEFTLARDIPVKRKDGTVFYADINSSPVILEGRTCLIGMFRDITERRDAREELKKRINELEDFYKMAVGRELKMKELKEEVQRLKDENESLKRRL